MTRGGSRNFSRRGGGGFSKNISKILKRTYDQGRIKDFLEGGAVFQKKLVGFF